MKSCCFLILLIIAWISPLQLLHAQNEQVQIDSLLVELGKAKDDTNKVKLYITLLDNHIYCKGEEGLKYSKPAIELSKKLNWQSGVFMVNIHTGRIYWKLGKFNEALKWHFEALKIAESPGNQAQLPTALNSIGQDYTDNANYPEALKYFNRACQVAEKNGNRQALRYSYSLISLVYGLQGNHPESAKYNLACLQIDEEDGDICSAAIAMSNLGDDYHALGNDSMALHYLDSSIVLLQRWGKDNINLGLIYISVGLIHQQHKNDAEALKYFELGLKTGNETDDKRLLSDAYRNIAGVSTEKGNDSIALKNLLLAVEVLSGQDVNQPLAALYIDIGACYTRMKQYTPAKKYFDDAWTLLKKIESEEMHQEYYGNLELLDSATGNWKDAYANYKTHIRLNEKIYNDANTKKLMQSSMRYEYDKKEAVAKAEQEKKNILQRTIRNSIAATLAGALIFLVVVYRQRNKISKARRRSDELLLNILPGEVAEELKEKGSADAKHFDEVTVMFTDFKGFTQISEKLSPTELVNEIHSCFKEFDNIISKHNIEKIKTIGDSYMCAGGLPVANKTNAEDIVRAALEIQKLMQAPPDLPEGEESHRAGQVSPLGRFRGAVRIGIHTGPVVAGIVGVKKFAYDIWGDTVNIASRMESSGEAGKVNISGSTYQLVKDKFNCIHRGKIQAKNKGEIDMYFVERSFSEV